ncbi:putative RNA binding protein YcfA (HicA-like mRNA interferase family) [Allonocardiopsis opalescens]|uniref:Putative RNA binding protein YcfA (HicA-like mRNA interferase family) n=1 Tax=Allonocardiopsis opalescens TaxID=1144618 RepID=A0A2T0Q3R4_9ACTN|nr:putative RNA binding protein YcfA (HicA-like mRNA interferase family) [Allonocardiopsis opalescens]
MKILEHLGFERRGGKGSHTKMRKGTLVVVVPHARELPVGTPAATLKQADLTPERLRELD